MYINNYFPSLPRIMPDYMMYVGSILRRKRYGKMKKNKGC